MKKNIFLLSALLAGMALTSCTDDAFVGEAPPSTPEEVKVPILFSSVSDRTTRANFVGADAAEKLGNKFVVSGYKGESSATVGNVVFDNYLVNYIENSANTTESNTSNWEYVGQGRIKHAIDNKITSQTTKYWDYSKSQYDFIAWSTGTKTAIFEKPAAGVPAGSVLVSAITPTTATGATGVAYTFEGAAADLQECYIADLVTVKTADYGKTVNLTFRSLGSKVRIGIYETVPGYSVKKVEFYSAAASDDAQATTPKLFTTTANDIYTKGIYTVYYPTVDAPSNDDNNQAHIRFAGTGTQTSYVDFGGLNYTIAEQGEQTEGAVFLGRSSNEATMAGEAEGNYYTQYLPNETGTNLNLRVNYTLESIDGSGEEIVVKGATAQVPSIYTQWKAGFAYTYIFKISDKTNGYTGVYDPTNPNGNTTASNPAGLYPITFDAVVVDTEDNDVTQETITTVSAPSITTYQQGSTVVNDNEYEAIGDIYVTVNDATTGASPDLPNGALQKLTGKAALYTLVAGKTEAEVIDAMQMQDDDAAAGTVKGRSGLVLTKATLTLTDKVEFGVDGNAITVGEDQAAKFTPASGTYAFVYTKTAPTTTTDKFQPVTVAAGDVVNGYYRFDYKTGTHSFYDVDDNGTPADDTDDVITEYFDAQKGVKYFSLTGGVYAMVNAFLGQNVNNLYLDAAGSAIASGYAVTGTDYYYTTNNGMSYTKAANIAYAKFAAATDLYTFAGVAYTLKTDAAPVNGTAYYQKTNVGGVDVYTYCVILPQQVNTLYELDEAAPKVACTATEEAIAGQTYFDKYTQNNGVYYAKVIRVQ